MLLTFPQLLLMAAIIVVAGIAQGTSGFGFGLVAVALLGAILPLKDASVMLALASLCMNIFILARLRTHFSFERIRWLLLATVIGVPVGVGLLAQADETLLRRLLGTVLLLAVAQRFIPFVKSKRWHPTWIGIPCGLLSGALAGAFATGGPPVVAYVQSQRFDRFRYAASVQASLALAASVRIACLGTVGLFTPRLLTLSAIGACCAIGGAWLGLLVLKRLPDHQVRRLTLATLSLLAIHYLIWS